VRTRDSNRIDEFEALRGLMALWVVAGPVIHTVDIGPEPASWLRLLARNPYAVNVFIALSGFVIYALQDAGELGITHDVAALKEVVRSLERGTLPSAHARLTGIYDLPATPALPVAAPATSVSFLARLFGLGVGVAAL
jgi:hypothetical protein